MSSISRKNQITLPVDVLRSAGLKPGDDVRITAVAPGHIELVKTESIIERYAGSLGDDVYPPGYLEDVRAGWR